jgi:hypothetical protein
MDLVASDESFDGFLLLAFLRCIMYYFLLYNRESLL